MRLSQQLVDTTGTLPRVGDTVHGKVYSLSASGTYIDVGLPRKGGSSYFMVIEILFFTLNAPEAFLPHREYEDDERCLELMPGSQIFSRVAKIVVRL